jgi:hypothetical protein
MSACDAAASSLATSGLLAAWAQLLIKTSAAKPMAMFGPLINWGTPPSRRRVRAPRAFRIRFIHM